MRAIPDDNEPEYEYYRDDGAIPGIVRTEALTAGIALIGDFKEGLKQISAAAFWTATAETY
jgi:hypothetical protein